MLVNFVNLFLIIGSFYHSGITSAEDLFIIVSSDFPYFLGFCMEVYRFENIFWVPGFSYGTSINLIKEE